MAVHNDLSLLQSLRLKIKSGHFASCCKGAWEILAIHYRDNNTL